MTSIRDHVLEFHKAFEHPTAPKPCIPADERVRFRAKLITEEYLETMRSMFDWTFGIAEDELDRAMENSNVRVDLVEMADGLADLDYVVEGTRLEFGIDGGPIAAEVHRSNMAKLGGGRRSDGKTLKPAGWTPPDIARELAKQGARCGKLYTYGGLFSPTRTSTCMRPMGHDPDRCDGEEKC